VDYKLRSEMQAKTADVFLKARPMRRLMVRVLMMLAALAPLSAKAEERNAAERGISSDPLNVYWTLYRSKSADPAVRLRASELFSGIVFALGFANADLLGNHRAPLYCQPEKLFLSVGQHIDMLERCVRDEKGQTAGAEFGRYIDNMKVAMAMLYALKETFPCKGAN
jgi:hypothetical protein